MYYKSIIYFNIIVLKLIYCLLEETEKYTHSYLTGSAWSYYTDNQTDILHTLYNNNNNCTQ